MARPYLPATLPMEFAEDFGEDSEEESTPKCCPYPRSRLKQKRDRPRDSSTIIEFVQLSKEGQSSHTVSAVSSPLLSRKHPENVKNNTKAVSGYEASSNSGQSQSSPAPLPRDRDGVKPRTRTIVYHEDLGATYVGIPQPLHVVTRRRESVVHPLLPRDESILSLGEFERKYEQERGLYQSNGSMSLSSHSLLSPPSEDISLSTMNSSGYKFKTQLLSRYSIELEEENRMLKQLISQHLEPVREVENPIQAALKGDCSRENRMKSEDALEKLKEISNTIEYQRHKSCSMDLIDLSRTLPCNGALSTGNLKQMSCKDPGDFEISSEISSLSGYRSSEHSEENHEEEDVTVEDILDNAIDTAVCSSAVEKRNENVHKRSILKSLKPDRSKLFLNVSPGPGCEELPDLECVKTQVKSVQAVNANIADTFPPYSENKQLQHPACFSPDTRRKISFLSSDGTVVASSGLGSHEVVRSSQDPVPDSEDVFTRLRKISDTLGPRIRIPDPDTGSLVFVDTGGRVLATTQVKSPPGVRRQVKTVESRLLSGALPLTSAQPPQTLETPASPAWVRMREISRHLEESGPSLI